MSTSRTLTPRCQKYALYVSDGGRKVTQPWPFAEEPPMFYDTIDGERLPLRMVGTYHPEDERTSHVAIAKRKATTDWADVERRRREFSAKRYGRAS